jgi:hypothetical protein
MFMISANNKMEAIAADTQKRFVNVSDRRTAAALDNIQI